MSKENNSKMAKFSDQIKHQNLTACIDVYND